MTTIAERTCIGCEHWRFDGGYPGYSEYTPGEDWSAECTKGYWYLRGHDVRDGDWVKAMQKAKTCADYQPRPVATS